MARILAIGIATLDIICLLDNYPEEDAKLRARTSWRCRGGNATNTLTVLRQMGHACAWAGTLASDDAAQTILADLASQGVDTQGCRVHRQGQTPVSYIWRSMATGSRTIVHHRDLPEFSIEDFQRIDLADIDWLHFEGRNIDDTAQMLAQTRTRRPGLPCSLEVEKHRPGIETLFADANVLIFSRDYVRHTEHHDPLAFLKELQTRYGHAALVCTWGAQGAWCVMPSGKPVQIKAFAPKKVVDTLGAGDTFNAGLIDALLTGQALESATQQACRLAGKKCGQEGLQHL